jgi:4-amino-4-deoxy-L-arabinose transferase-like glycosyltransferase
LPTLLSGSRIGTLCVLLVAVFYLASFREGHDWGDDFSQYIHHAENLANGAPYADSGYLYNPDNPSFGPRQYPPGFPLALAPIVRTFGLDLLPMKVEVVLFFLAALLLMYGLIRDLMPPAAAAAAVLLVGLNPYFWDFKDQVLSDLPFLFFFLASLLCLTRAEEIERSRRNRVAFSVLGGVAMYFAYATRIVGVVLLPSLIVRDLILHRRLTRESMVASATFSVLAGLHHVIWAGETGYTDLLTVNVPTIVANLI